MHDLVLVPVHLQAELDLAVHLLQHVGERVVRALEELLDVVLGAEDGAETHRQHGEIFHHQLVHVLVRQRVFTRRIEDDERTVGDDGGEFFVRNGVDLVAAAADADRPEIARDIGLDDAVNVLALLRFGLLRLCLIFHFVGDLGGMTRSIQYKPFCQPAGSPPSPKTGSANISARCRGARCTNRTPCGFPR